MTATGAKYETLGVLGRGGMATVFLGRSRGAAGFSRLVAVKRAHVHARADAESTASLRHEASLAARLHHPNVVRVIDVVETDEVLDLVLDYVEGGTLAELLLPARAVFRDARSRARIVVRIMLDIAAGLGAAHRAVDDEGASLGIVHRDVSPSNVLVGTDGIARLTDFGIAKALEGGTELTETGVLKGKLAYMAPEYVEHHRADAASDQFSLAVVTWEGLAAQRLFRGAHEIDTLKRVTRCQVPSLAAIEPLLAPLEPVLTRALSRASADRFPGVRELAEALEAAARSADLVASHGEVGELVERALPDDLAARRALARGLTDGAEQGERSEVSEATASPRGRDDVPTASLVSRPPRGPSASARPLPSASPGASAPPSRRWTLALPIGVALVVIGLGASGAWRARREATASEAIGTSTTATGEGLPSVPSAKPSAMSLAGEADVTATDGSATLAASSPGTLPPAPRRRTHAGSGAGRRVPSVAGSVPRKAPPNPYLE